MARHEGRGLLRRRFERGPVLKRLRDQVFKLTTKVLDPTHFDVEFVDDIRDAQSEVIIYCPFTNAKRVGWFIGRKEFKDAINRGVSIKLVTRKPEQRRVRNPKEHKENINRLQREGVSVYVRDWIHCKGVIIDRKIVYLGSMNILYEPGHEEDYMVRFVSEALADEVLETVGEPTDEELVKPESYN